MTLPDPDAAIIDLEERVRSLELRLEHLIAWLGKYTGLEVEEDA